MVGEFNEANDAKQADIWSGLVITHKRVLERVKICQAKVTFLSDFSSSHPPSHAVARQRQYCYLCFCGGDERQFDDSIPSTLCILVSVRLPIMMGPPTSFFFDVRTRHHVAQPLAFSRLGHAKKDQKLLNPTHR